MTNPQITIPQDHATATDHTFASYPRLREQARSHYMSEDPGSVTTTYTQIDDHTERVTWTNPQGQGFSWVQTWPCPLVDAPQLGNTYRVLHEEWFNDNPLEARRTIHAFELVPPTADHG